MQKATAVLITIGDELLIGQVVDTNSAWIARQLSQAGIPVKRRIAVGDEADAIVEALDQATDTANIVIITGGLGPTADDITKPVLARYFGGFLKLHQPTVEHLQQLFTQVLKRPLTERNLSQAMLPDVCTVLFNEQGTAPGMQFSKGETLYYSLPGVPSEMQGLMNTAVLPALRLRFPEQVVAHRTLMTAGIGESFLADRIQPFEEALPAHIKLAYLPNYGMVRLRLTGQGTSADELNKEIDTLFLRLKKQLSDLLVTDRDETLAQHIHRLFLQNGKTLSVAESCTGGHISAQITAQESSSQYFMGSVVSYSNEAKTNMLDVPEQLLQEHGAVSAEVAEAMARGARERLHTDYAIASSGILGPGGGSPQKPVGTLFLAVAGPQKTISKLFKLRFTREKNTEQAVTLAFNLLREFIRDGEPSA